jgi:hypothetical protein
LTGELCPLARLLQAFDLPGFIARLRRIMGDRDTPEAIAALAAHAFGAAGRPEARTPLEAACLDLNSCMPAFGGTRPRQVVPRALDVLAADSGPEEWTTAQWIAQVRLRAHRPARGAAVVATMRDDGLTALEWIAHYRLLGFDSIYIYSNDNVDGSDRLLDLLAQHGIITYIENEVASSTHPQRKAYAHALHLLPELHDHRWALFADSDEFLTLAPRHRNRIDSLLGAVARHFPERQPGAVCFHWRVFHSEGRYAWEPLPLMVRFQRATLDHYMKSLVRLADVTSMCHLHFPDLVEGAGLVDASFAPIAPNTFWDERVRGTDHGQIDHYWAKSFEEFSLKKARGDALTLVGNDYVRDFGDFFTLDRPTEVTQHVSPPAGSLALLEREITALAALPGVAEAEANCRARLPEMLHRFDAAGGLPAIYKRSHSAA